MELRRDWGELAGRMAAEFAIVVLGVSLALWADDWASDRSDRRKEISRLSALRDNVDETLIAIGDHLDEAKQASKHLRAVITNPSAPPQELQERLGWALFYGPVFSPELNVYDELKNSGELSLLTNAELRSALARMDASMRRIELAQSDLTAVQQMHIDSFAVDSAPVRLFYAEEVGLARLTPGDDAPFAFVDDPRFRGRMVLKLDLVGQLELRFRQAEDSLSRVRESIDQQLDSR